MGCGSSKETPVVTNAMRIEIAPEQTPIENVLFIKSTRSDSESNTPVETVGKAGVSVRPPSNPARSPPSSSLVLSLRRRRLSPDRKRVRRSTASIISVEPCVSADVTQRQISASSRMTADSGFSDESRAGISAGSRRNEEFEIMDFITKHSSCGTDPERPVTPELLIEGTPFLLPKHKLSHLPGSVDTVQLVTTANILEKAPLPPIHTLRNSVIKPSVTSEEKSAQRMQVEQSFEVIERPPSRGGLAFDILMDVPTEKKALRPIEFSPEYLLDKKGGKKRRSALKLTKEGIEVKLAAAEERRNKRESDIINSLVEQREIDEKRMIEKQEKYQKSIENREITLGARMRTMSNNRDVAISTKVRQAHIAQQKVENARNSRKLDISSSATDTNENTN